MDPEFLKTAAQHGAVLIHDFDMISFVTNKRPHAELVAELKEKLVDVCYHTFRVDCNPEPQDVTVWFHEEFGVIAVWSRELKEGELTLAGLQNWRTGRAHLMTMVLKGLYPGIDGIHVHYGEMDLTQCLSPYDRKLAVHMDELSDVPPNRVN